MGIKASQEGLEKIEQARINKGWKKQDLVWYQLAGTSLSVLKRFLRGTEVRQDNFISLCKEVGIEDWKSIADLTPSSSHLNTPPSPNLYNPHTWVGREDLINELLDKFNQNTRILWLTGISGVGKTALGKCLAFKVIENKPSFHWLSILIPDNQLSDFATGSRNILEELGEKNIDPQEMNDPKRLCDRLFNKLKSKSYWLQIDGVEKLIDANNFHDPYWLTFFERCLTTSEFSSRLVVTSQVLPEKMWQWENTDDYKYSWYYYSLKGLKEHEILDFFEKHLCITLDSLAKEGKNILTDIGKIYEGHPLVLEVIAGEIRQDYGNDVTEYWEVNKQEFEQVERELLSDRLSPAFYNEELQKRIRQRIETSLKQLSDNALNLLKRSSVYRRSVPKNFWQEMLWESSEKEKENAYSQLSDRTLIEKEKGLIRQHNLIRDIAYDLLREDIEIWKAAEQKAAEIWIDNLSESLKTLFQNSHEKNWSFLPEDISGEPIDQLIIFKKNTISDLTYLGFIIEAYNHFFEANCYEESATALFLVDRFWYRWGNINNLLNYINKLESKKVTLPPQIIIRKARCFRDKGEVEKAIEIAENIKKSNSDQDIIVSAVADEIIGSCYSISSDHNKAIEAYEEALKKHRLKDNMKGISSTYGNIGDAYFELNDLEKAIENYKEASKKTENDYYLCRNLGRIGKVYIKQNKYKQAIEIFKNNLIKITKNKDKNLLKNSLDIAKIRLHLGKAFIGDKNFSQAKEVLELAQETFRVQNVEKFLKECQELLLKIQQNDYE
ncbi:MAG: tetratricopeptide repeat protein [Crocosphaera sp.]